MKTRDRQNRWTFAAAAVCALLLLMAFARVQQANRQASAAAPSGGVLRVCADPNNLPFTNERQEGFENRIANLLAEGLHARVEYTWWRQSGSFFRNTLKANRCDLVLGAPSRFDQALTTKPYYTSTYVFLARRDRGLDIRSLNDPRLRKLRIGVHLINDDDQSPAAIALERRGLAKNIRWYSIYGTDYRKPNPPAAIAEAVAKGDVDIAIVWGPIAGYFAAQQKIPLTVTQVEPQVDIPALPFVYAISMGVRKEDTALRDTLDSLIARDRERIEQILDEYHVPRIAPRPQS